MDPIVDMQRLKPSVPLHEWLIPELAIGIFSHLHGDDVVALGLVSRRLLQLTRSEYVWRFLLSTHYLPRRTYVPQKARDLIAQGRFVHAQRALSADDKRDFLSEETLCSIEWSFRFKRRAGEQWIRHDPYYTGYALPVLRFVGDPHYQLVRIDSTAWDGMALRWRFLDREGYPPGSWLRVNNYPSLRVSRHNEGGFVLQSMWLMYSSFPCPPPGADPALDDEAEIDEVQRMEVALHRASIPVPDRLDELRLLYSQMPAAARDLTPEEMELD